MARSYVSYHPGLMTDMYHPDAAYVSWRAGRNGRATFDLFARRAPFGGSYLLVAGLEMALEFVRDFHYTDEDLKYLAQVRDYEPEFLDELSALRFNGDILAMPEGSVAFPHEPLLRVTAPFREAILLESGLLQAINLATLIATKASRVTYAARNRRVAEFALRRAQEPYVATRAAHIGGCATTSFLGAAFRFRMFATGTIPHALVQLFDNEREAFESVAETFNRYTLVLDTYDVERAIHTAVEVAHRYQEKLGHTLAAVRVDSGDLLAQCRYVRSVLDAADLHDVKIAASGDLDEFTIDELVRQDIPADSFGVGTSLGVGQGSVEHDIEGGALGGVYKLVHYEAEAGEEQPKIKVAGEKSTWPGRKEVYRIGQFERDVIQLAEEPRPEGTVQRLLKPVVLDGKVVPGSLPPLNEIWELAQQNLRELPEPYRALRPSQVYPVEFSTRLRQLREDALAEEQGWSAVVAPRSQQANGRDAPIDAGAAEHAPAE
jgi:nicotinate phosphoribosyltransferase